MPRLQVALDHPAAEQVVRVRVRVRLRLGLGLGVGLANPNPNPNPNPKPNPAVKQVESAEQAAARRGGAGRRRRASKADAQSGGGGGGGGGALGCGPVAGPSACRSRGVMESATATTAHIKKVRVRGRVGVEL